MIIASTHITCYRKSCKAPYAILFTDRPRGILIWVCSRCGKHNRWRARHPLASCQRLAFARRIRAAQKTAA